jgi:hypothetical protein
MGNTISDASYLASSHSLKNAGVNAGMAMIKKTNDIAKQEGDSIVQLIEDATAQISENRLDVYA